MDISAALSSIFIQFIVGICLFGLFFYRSKVYFEYSMCLWVKLDCEYQSTSSEEEVNVDKKEEI